jgi:hypothetical protein
MEERKNDGVRNLSFFFRNHCEKKCDVGVFRMNGYDANLGATPSAPTVFSAAGVLLFFFFFFFFFVSDEGLW